MAVSCRDKIGFARITKEMIYMSNATTILTLAIVLSIAITIVLSVVDAVR
tara:strand:- start:798 stop:947 length:150 start_codon:yes stop_codon:yes gene_type:complete